MLQAASLLRSDSVGLVPKESLAGRTSILKALGGLAFAPLAADLWHRLGIVPQEGPRPSEAMIEQRLAVAEGLLAATEGSRWPAADMVEVAAAVSRLAGAWQACLEMLPAVLSGDASGGSSREGTGRATFARVGWSSAAGRWICSCIRRRHWMKLSPPSCPTSRVSRRMPRCLGS